MIGAGWAGKWLRARPIQWLGDHPYSIYLWHWPLLVFGSLVLRRELDDLERGALELANVLVPNPALVAADVVRRPECRQSANGEALHTCTLGPHAGFDKHLAAIGDSHLAVLLPALEVVAQQHDWRIDAASKNGCHWTTSTQRMSAGSMRACQRWKVALNQKLEAEPLYDAILVTHRAGAFLPDAAPGEDQPTTIVRGLLESWRTQTARGTRIIAIRDNPTATRSTAGEELERILC